MKKAKESNSNCLGLIHFRLPNVSRVKNPLLMQKVKETHVRSLGQGDPLEEGIATHCSILACRIPRTEESGGVYSPEGHKESDTTEIIEMTCMPSTF